MKQQNSFKISLEKLNAGIPANAAKLVLADVLKDKSTEFVVQDGWASDSKTFGIIMPKRDNLRCSININKFDVKQANCRWKISF